MILIYIYKLKMYRTYYIWPMVTKTKETKTKEPKEK